MFVKDGKILLGMKKRGFGTGKWNGYGGKLMPGEDIHSAAIREIKEESGLDVQKENLEELGVIDFHYMDNLDWNQRRHIFRITEWKGEPIETEEMKPGWFSFDEIPFENMWVSDPAWYPHFLNGEKFKATIYFSEEGKSISKIEVQKI